MYDSLVSAELMTTGWCPNKCTYCYIPKTDEMMRLHEKIEEDLKSGRFIDNLERLYGSSLSHLSFWGTEPTLTLPIIKDWLPELFVRFPKLTTLMFSTSLVSQEDRIVDFIRSLVGRKVNLTVQVSIDGPGFISDVNRFPGAAERVPENFYSVLESLQDVKFGDFKVRFTFKVTHSIENIRMLNSNPELFTEYLEYFTNIEKHVKEINKNPQVDVAEKSYGPTLVVPGKYTSDDGKEFAKYLETFHKLGISSAYDMRFKRLLKFRDDLHKRRQFTCSGGDSNMGIGGQYHICHRTFYLNKEEYIESVLSTDIDNWDVSHFQRGMIDHIVKNYIVDYDDRFRFAYVLRGYHDFWAFQVGYMMACLRELGEARQVDRIYTEDEQFAVLFALFLNQAMSCPMENLLNTGSINLQILSIIRMFANGAFQEVIRYLDKDVSTRE